LLNGLDEETIQDIVRMLGVRGRVKRRRLVVQRRIAAATVELVAGDRENRTPIWTSC
jgi:hypothetical protein